MKALLSLVLSISAVAAEDAGVVSALADSASFTFFDGRVITMGRHGARVVLDASF